jgi:hypothetical protein
MFPLQSATRGTGATIRQHIPTQAHTFRQTSVPPSAIHASSLSFIDIGLSRMRKGHCNVRRFLIAPSRRLLLLLGFVQGFLRSAIAFSENTALHKHHRKHFSNEPLTSRAGSWSMMLPTSSRFVLVSQTLVINTQTKRVQFRVVQPTRCCCHEGLGNSTLS